MRSTECPLFVVLSILSHYYKYNTSAFAIEQYDWWVTTTLYTVVYCVWPRWERPPRLIEMSDCRPTSRRNRLDSHRRDTLFARLSRITHRTTVRDSLVDSRPTWLVQRWYLQAAPTLPIHYRCKYLVDASSAEDTVPQAKSISVKSEYLYSAPESWKRFNGARRAVENRCVFSARLKALSDRSSDSSAGGRRFHVVGPFTAKLRCPVAVRTRWTSIVPVAADRSWRPEMAVRRCLWDRLERHHKHTSSPSRPFWGLLAD